MRTRGPAAAVVGAAGAALTRALDVAGLLPGVHEGQAVRSGMGPGATTAWLLLAAALAWLVGISRRWWVGIAVCVLVSGAPELVARHDPGAIGEPGALLGALVQLLLLLMVLALVVIVESELRRPRPPVPSWQRSRSPLLPVDVVLPGVELRLDANPRAPPAMARPALSPSTERSPWLNHDVIACSRSRRWCRC